MHMKRKLLYICAVLCFMACEKSYNNEYEIQELAVRDSVMVFGTEASDCILPVFANGIVNVELMGQGNDWVSLESNVINGDGSLSVKVADNTDGLPRQASIRLALEGTGLQKIVYVKQEGKLQALACPMYIDDEFIVDNDGGHAEVMATGRVPLAKGLHKYTILYFEDYEGEAFSWGWKAPSQSTFSSVPVEALFCK